MLVGYDNMRARESTFYEPLLGVMSSLEINASSHRVPLHIPAPQPPMPYERRRDDGFESPGYHRENWRPYRESDEPSQESPRVIIIDI